MNTTNNLTVADKLHKLKLSYQAQLPEKMEEISQAWEVLRDADWEVEVAQQLHHYCHRIAGTGRTFGYSQLTDLAREVEHLLDEVLSAGALPDEVYMQRLAGTMGRLLSDGPKPDAE